MIPLGSVIALGNEQAWALPTINEIKDGWALCNGNTFASLVGYFHPNFTGSRPNLNDSRFIQGSNAIGAAAGANSVTLVSGNMPLLSSTNNSVGHTHYVSGNTYDTNYAPAQYHRHQQHNGAVDRDHIHYTYRTGLPANVYSNANINIPWNGVASYTTGWAGAHTHSFTSGTVNTGHLHTGNTFPASDHSAAHTHSIGGAATAISVIPPYLPMAHLIRVNNDGNFPIGTVVPIANSQAWALPASGTVKDGWALCNGVAFSALSGGTVDPRLTGTLPQLSDSRFIMGSSGVGVTGGASSVTLSSANIPTTTSVAGGSHHHSTAYNIGDINTNHTHAGSTPSDGDHTHGISAQTAQGAYNTQWTMGGASGAVTSSGSQNHAHGISLDTTDTNHTHRTDGLSVGWQSQKHTHTYGTASPTAISLLPSYFSVVFIMKVS